MATSRPCTPAIVSLPAERQAARGPSSRADWSESRFHRSRPELRSDLEALPARAAARPATSWSTTLDSRPHRPPGERAATIDIESTEHDHHPPALHRACINYVRTELATKARRLSHLAARHRLGFPPITATLRRRHRIAAPGFEKNPHMNSTSAPPLDMARPTSPPGHARPHALPAAKANIRRHEYESGTCTTSISIRCTHETDVSAFLEGAAPR